MRRNGESPELTGKDNPRYVGTGAFVAQYPVPRFFSMRRSVHVGRGPSSGGEKGGKERIVRYGPSRDLLVSGNLKRFFSPELAVRGTAVQKTFFSAVGGTPMLMLAGKMLENEPPVFSVKREEKSPRKNRPYYDLNPVPVRPWLVSDRRLRRLRAAPARFLTTASPGHRHPLAWRSVTWNLREVMTIER